MRVGALFFLPLLICLGTAHAQSEGLVVSDGKFEKQHKQILKDLNDGKTYSEIDSRDRAKVRDSLSQMSRLLDGVDSVAELSDDQRITVFNLQEEINTILTRARRDSRLVCDRQGSIGTNFRSSRCETVAARERRRQRDQDDLRALQGARSPLGD